MAMISAPDRSKVFDTLATHLDNLELEIKAAKFEEDVRTAAKRIFDELALRMRQESSLDSELVDLALNIIQGKFYSPWGIVPDLKKWQENPAPITSSECRWYELCTNKKRT